MEYLYGPQTLRRSPSTTITRQSGTTCWIHTTVRLFIKMIRNYVPELSDTSGPNCQPFYENMYSIIRNFETFRQCSLSNQDNLLLYIFLYAILENKFGCENGSYLESAIIYLNDILTKIFLEQQQQEQQERQERQEQQERQQEYQNVFQKYITSGISNTDNPTTANFTEFPRHEMDLCREFDDLLHDDTPTIEQIFRNFFKGLYTMDDRTRMCIMYFCEKIKFLLSRIFKKFYSINGYYLYDICLKDIRIQEKIELFQFISYVLENDFYLYISFVTKIIPSTKRHACIIFDAVKNRDNTHFLILKNSWGQRPETALSQGELKLSQFLGCKINNGYIHLPLERLFEEKYDFKITFLLPNKLIKKPKTAQLNKLTKVYLKKAYLLKFSISCNTSGGNKTRKNKNKKNRKSRKNK